MECTHNQVVDGILGAVQKLHDLAEGSEIKALDLGDRSGWKLILPASDVEGEKFIEMLIIR